MNPIRVALVNDYDVVVHGVMAMLRAYEDVIDVVELDANKEVATRVDITLLDTFAGPQGNSAEVRRFLHAPNIDRLVIYSWVVEPAVVDGALAQGAAAYLSKQLPAAKLVQALVDVHRGETVAPPEPSATSVAVVGGDWPGREEGITPRESEVLALIAHGYSNAEISQATYLSINSVKTYIRNCYRRIGVRNRAQAVLWALDHGFRADRSRQLQPAERSR